MQGLRTLLKGGVAVARLADAFDIVRSLPHGHVAAVLGTLRKLRLERTLAPEHGAQRDRVLAMIVARILNPRIEIGHRPRSDARNRARLVGRNARPLTTATRTISTPP